MSLRCDNVRAIKCLIFHYFPYLRFLHKLRLEVIKVDVPPPGVPVWLSRLSILSLPLHVGFRSEAPDLHMLDVEGVAGGELDGVESVDVPAG